MSGGMPVYRKQGDHDKWLMYHPPNKYWSVQPTSAKGTSSSYAYLTCDPPCLPENGTKRTWKVVDGPGPYNLQADVDISIATTQEVAAAAEAFAASVSADGRKVNEQKYKHNSFLYLG